MKDKSFEINTQKTNKKILQKYYEDYRDGKISFRDIPSGIMSREIMLLSAEKEPSLFIEFFEKTMTFDTLLSFIENINLDNSKKQILYDRLFDIRPEIYFKYFPDDFKTQEMYNRLFHINPEKYFLQIPLEFMTKEMCIIFFNINPTNNFNYIPEKFRTQEMYEWFFNQNPQINFMSIPEEFMTQEMYSRLFHINPEIYFKYIPEKFLLKGMYNLLFHINPAKYIKYIPEKHLTQKMCDSAFELSPEDVFIHIPEKYKTKSMYFILIKRNIEDCHKFIPTNLLNDDEILACIICELKIIIAQNKEIKLSSELFYRIIKLYPWLIKAFGDDELEEAIVSELYNIARNNGTIEDICKKYRVNNSFVEDILEKIKTKNFDIYNMIKEKLVSNQSFWFLSMLKDVDNLMQIISLLGSIKNNSLNVEQKIKFTFLCSKHIHHPLEEIYAFCNKNAKKDTTIIISFFNNILKYKQLFNDKLGMTSNEEINTILLNNSWLNDYNRTTFFGIKNGVPTIENKYGKNAELLTLNQEMVIIEMLKAENIPLKEVIVKNAFREYFKNNLIEYIYMLKKYDQEFETSQKKQKNK